MPTIQIKPGSSRALDDVANFLAKSKKVVVVTGAGISTNSGIPDFRSQNGLYSLIQAQFEKAEADGTACATDESGDGFPNERPVKRRRVSRDGSVGPPACPAGTSSPSVHLFMDELSTPTLNQVNANEAMTQLGVLSTQSQSAISSASLHIAQEPPWQPLWPGERRLPQSSVVSSCRSNSPLQDGSAELGTDSVSTSGTPEKRLTPQLHSSSPLSSPPPIIFDPYEDDECGGSRSMSPETEDTASTDPLSSQASQAGLRNMKGRDLFDCNIWSDPLKTSVFYRFATSLRQKVKDVEPTTTHHFIATLRDVGKLARVYTQNIDEIEKKIGLSTDLKNGAGTRRRRSTKQLPATEPEKAFKEENNDGKSDACLTQSSQTSEEGDHAKPKMSLVVDKGVECVFLHGSLHALRCFACGRLSDWDNEGRESCTMAGEQPDCPHCAGATAARLERGKRPLGVGKLRPDIVLYGEEHPQSESISNIVQHDLSAGPDLLLVLGTSLRVHGLKVMVREFAKSVHNKGGKVVFVNFTKPPESIWGDVIDYWIEWDCDAWVDDLRDRKPVLWMSPEAALEHHKQQREARREEKREAMAEKKRENISMRKRHQNSAGNNDDANTAPAKRRRTIDVVETARVDPRPPPKNPVCMRLDHANAAMCLSAISEVFARGRRDPSYSLFGYTPPTDRQMQGLHSAPAAVATSKDKRPRKSAPGGLDAATAVPSSTLVSFFGSQRYLGPRQSAMTGIEAAAKVSAVGVTEKDCRPAYPALKNSRPANKLALKCTPAASPAASPPSIVAAVKSNHRVRKPKTWFDSDMTAVSRQRTKTQKPQAVNNRENVLPPLNLPLNPPVGPRLPAMEPEPDMNLRSPLEQGPLATLSPNVRTFSQYHYQRPLRVSGPLMKLSYGVGGETARTPSEQLIEETEAAEFLCLRTC